MRPLLRLVPLVLLLAAVACQRANYPVAAGGGYAAARRPTPADSGRAEAPAVASATGPGAGARLRPKPPTRRLWFNHGHAPTNAAAHVLAAATAATAVPRRPRLLRRAPAMSEDTKFGLLAFGSSALLVAGGLALALGVGGGLAVALGVLLVLVGVVLALLSLYALAFAHNMGH